MYLFDHQVEGIDGRLRVLDVDHLTNDVHFGYGLVHLRADLIKVLVKECQDLGIGDQIEQLLFMTEEERETKGILISRRRYERNERLGYTLSSSIIATRYKFLSFANASIA